MGASINLSKVDMKGGGVLELKVCLYILFLTRSF